MFTPRDSAAQLCGIDCVSTETGVLTCYEAAARDTSGPHSKASYDLRTGHIFVSCAYYVAQGPEVQTNDLYTVVGLTPGTPLTFRAQLVLSGRHDGSCSPSGNCNYGVVSASLVESPSNRVDYFSSSGSGFLFNAILSLPIQRAAGETFRLSIDALAAVYDYNPASIGSAKMDVQLRFVDLPVGAVVTSCQGFREDTFVPVRRASWGRLKALYR
jgi:hypothetical protein